MSAAKEANTSGNSTSPMEFNCDPFLDSEAIRVIKTIAYSLLLIFSLAGNSLVVAVIWRKRRLQTIINLFILNMSISDLIMPLVALPKRIQNIYLPEGLWLADGVFGLITCKFMPFAEDTSVAVSVLTLEVIAIERFCSVVLAMKKQPIHSKKTCFICITFIWVIATFYPSTHLYTFKIIHVYGTPYCVWGWGPTSDITEDFSVQFPIVFVCLTVIPFILLTSLYSTIIIYLHREKSHVHLASDEMQRRVKENRRVTFMLLAVVVLFFVTWAPLNLYIFLSSFVWSSPLPCDSRRHLVFSTKFLSYMYPGINPILYYVFLEHYRKGFRELLCCVLKSGLCCKKHRSPTGVEGGPLNAGIILTARHVEVH